MEEKYYQFNLDDYSAPSCTSEIKYYYGTVDDVDFERSKFCKQTQDEHYVLKYVNL